MTTPRAKETSVYLCADATLTYGPMGGTAKIVRQALPVCVVGSPGEAELLISLVGKRAWHPVEDPDFAQQLGRRTIKPGYGPRQRFFYSLPNFRRETVEDLFAVRETMESLRDATRADDRVAVQAAFEKAKAREIAGYPPCACEVDGCRCEEYTPYPEGPDE